MDGDMNLETEIPQSQTPENLPSFDQQFKDRKTLQSEYGNMEYVKLASQEPDKDNAPLVVIPGWSITLNTEKDRLGQEAKEKQNADREVEELEKSVEIADVREELKDETKNTPQTP